jgi:hypothetical protein
MTAASIPAAILITIPAQHGDLMNKRIVLFRGLYKKEPCGRSYEGSRVAYVSSKAWRCVVPIVPGLDGKRITLIAEVITPKRRKLSAGINRRPNGK